MQNCLIDIHFKMAYRRGQEVFREPKPFSYVVLPKYRKVVCDCCLEMCENEVMCQMQMDILL